MLSHTVPACWTLSTCSLFAHPSQKDLLLQCSLPALDALDAGLQPARLRGFQARLPHGV